jgi:L-threonylcarbamoyladenylate synthase
VSEHADVGRAVRSLRAGRLVVLPTDTVYGVAAAPAHGAAVEAIFAVKGRRGDKPLAVLAASVDDLVDVVEIDERARVLGARYWPGPLTMVLRRAARCSWDLGAGIRSPIGVRVPDCEVAVRILSEVGPLAVSSANRSGEAPAETVAAARAALGSAVDVYVDAGRRDGAVSTVLSLVDAPVVLRSGALGVDDVTLGDIVG